jgi:hypothetical protein
MYAVDNGTYVDEGNKLDKMHSKNNPQPKPVHIPYNTNTLGHQQACDWNTRQHRLMRKG